ncbi:MAG: DMT family transporter, partial [Sneathiella sp.]|nr:DMT family transporter [Sneathiella sp.]
ILLFRQIFVFLSTVPAIAKSPTQIFITKHPGMHAARLLGAFVALACSIWAVAVLPLTAAITLGFAQVFFVALLAKAFLGEHVGLRRMMAVMVGFIGVIIVMRPGADDIIDLGALIPIVGALGAGVAVIAVRRLSQTETTASLLVYQAVFVGLLAAVPLIWYWKTPTEFELIMLIAMGILSAAGQWAGVKSLRLGEASVVGNIEYMKLIYAAILGLVLFSELPDLYTITGAVIIVGSSLYMFRREAKAVP